MDLAKFKEGDQQAFKEMFDKLNPRLMSWLQYKYSKERFEDLEDFAGEIWYKIFLRREQFESSDHIEAFAFRSATNALIDKYRKRTEEIQYFNDAIEEIIEGFDQNVYEIKLKSEAWQNTVSYIYELIEQQPAARKRSIELLYYIQWDKFKIAALVGVAPQTVLNTKTAFLNKVRSQFKALEHLFAGYLNA